MPRWPHMLIPSCTRGSHIQVCYDFSSAGQIQPCRHPQQALGLCFGMANHECTPICLRRYMGSFRWWMWGGVASLWIHVICLDNTSPLRGVTRFAWWRQDLHAIELLRAHIGEWTITRMLDYWWVMCFTSYRLNWNPWIWIPFFPLIQIAPFSVHKLIGQDTAVLHQAIIV
jgi:hypothetical protein